MKQAQPRDPKLYDQEYKAMQASLEDYLKQQLDLISQGVAAAPERPRGNAGGGEASSPSPQVPRETGWWQRHRQDVYFVITLALIAFLWWRMPSRSPGVIPVQGGAAGMVPVQGATAPTAPPGEAVAPPPASVPPPPVAELLPAPSGLADPAAWWSSYVAGHRGEVAAWLSAIAEARGLAADEVSPRQKQNFRGWAEKAGAGAELTAAELHNFRIGLFEYVYASAVGDAAARAQWERVDLVVAEEEYDLAALTALLAELGRDHWFEAVDPSEAGVQTALVLAWLEGRDP